MNDSHDSEASTAFNLSGEQSQEVDVYPLVDLEDLRQGLKNLEHAVITNRLSLIQTSTARVTYCVKTILHATEFLQHSSNSALFQRFAKLAQQRLHVLAMLETLVTQSQNVLREDILEDELELETVHLLGSSEQILSLVQEFIFTADEYGIYAGGKPSSRQTLSIEYEILTFNALEQAHTLTESKSASFSLFQREDMDYNVDGFLLGGTIGALVEEMTPHDTLVDQAFLATFFLTFRLFSSPAELLENAILRWNLKPPSNISKERLHMWQHRKWIPVRLRVLNLIRTWILYHWESSDDSVLPLLESFLRETADFLEKSKTISLDLLQIVSQRLRPLGDIPRKRARGLSESRLDPKLQLNITSPTRRPSINQVLPFPAPFITKTLLTSLQKKEFGTISINFFDPLEFARQLTIMQSNLFCALLPSEIIGTGQTSDKPARSVITVMSLSTAITKWVSETIHREPENKKTKRLIKYFLQLANCCVELNNFASFRSILTALNSIDTTRSQLMRSGLPQKQKEQFDSLNLLANSHQYQRRLAETTPPAIPILTLHMADIVSCRNSLPSHVSSTHYPTKKLINFSKYREIAKIVQNMLVLQVPYSLKPIPEIQDYLHSIFTVTSAIQSTSDEPQYRNPLPKSSSRNDTNNPFVAKGSSPSKPETEPDREDMSVIGINPTDISIYSIPSSRTASTDYGIFYTRHACSQDSFGSQWWADSPESNPPPINV